MSCRVIFEASFTPIAGTPSENYEGGKTFHFTYECSVPDDTYVGVLVPISKAHPHCQSVQQYQFRAVSGNNSILANETDTCHRTHLDKWWNTCQASYDCINGSCELSSKYNTAGRFSSLQDCQQSCSLNNTPPACPPGQQCVDPDTFCPPGRVCLEQSEYSEINSKISQLHSLIC